MFGFNAPAFTLAAIIVAALGCAGVVLYWKGATDVRQQIAIETAREASRIVKDKARNDADLRTLPENDLCRELNGGQPCE